MHHSHSQAENLFSRLFSYVPKDGGRETIENYCTEALAWCLIHSPSFAREFLKLCELPLEDEEFSPEVHTQNSFNDEDAALRGQFDLIIISYAAPKFVVAIESKVWSKFQTNQLAKYKKRLQSDKFKDIPEKCRRLVTLTPTGKRNNEADAHIQWSQVQALLKHHANAQPSEQVAAILNQFAAFLNENGLTFIELMNITPQLLSQAQSAFKLEKALKAIVSQLRNQDELEEIIGRKPVINVEDGRIGVFGKIGLFGFGIAQIGNNWELFILVEICFEGDRRNLRNLIPAKLRKSYESAKIHMEALTYNDYANFNHLSDDNTTYFAFSQTVPPQLYADSNAIFDLLFSTSKAAIKFYNDNRIGRKGKRP